MDVLTGKAATQQGAAPDRLHLRSLRSFLASVAALSAAGELVVLPSRDTWLCATIQIMQYKVLWLTVITTFVSSCSANASTRVPIFDERGKNFGIVPSLKLSNGRLAIPANTFRYLNLAVHYVEAERRLYISIPRTNTIVGLRSGENRSYHPETGYTSATYTYPLVRKRRGHFYVSVYFMSQVFPDYFSYSWDKAERILTLKRGRVKRQQRQNKALHPTAYSFVRFARASLLSLRFQRRVSLAFGGLRAA